MYFFFISSFIYIIAPSKYQLKTTSKSYAVDKDRPFLFSPFLLLHENSPNWSFSAVLILNPRCFPKPFVLHVFVKQFTHVTSSSLLKPHTRVIPHVHYSNILHLSCLTQAAVDVPSTDAKHTSPLHLSSILPFPSSRCSLDLCSDFNVVSYSFKFHYTRNIWSR